MVNLRVVDSDFSGASKVTCAEAAQLLNEGKIRKAFFRPNGTINYQDAGNDEAYVWGLDHDQAQ